MGGRDLPAELRAYLMTTMERIEAIVGTLPEAVRVDVEAWDGEPTFRVNGKTFVFAAHDGSSISVKLPKAEAEALVHSDRHCTPTGYGLGRHGWVKIDIPRTTTVGRWHEIEEWITTSYTLVAPKRLSRLIAPPGGATPA